MAAIASPNRIVHIVDQKVVRWDDMHQVEEPPGRWAGISPYQWLIFAIGFLIVLADGYDTQATAFAAPLMRAEFGDGRATLGLVLSAALFGGLIGGLVIGPLGDRMGRKTILLASLAIVSLGTLATCLAHASLAIALLRLVTGFGLGGVIPGAISLCAEYAPARRRASIVAVVFSGFPFGAVVGSVVSALVLPHWGWRAVFLIGGLAPALLLLVAGAFLPESRRFLARRPRDADRLAGIEHSLGTAARDAIFPIDDADCGPAPNPVGELFTQGRGSSTLILWLICFASLLCTYCTISWLPTLAHAAGLPLQVAILAAGAINVGSVIGNAVVANLSDRRGQVGPIALSYLIGGVMVAIIGQASGSSWAMLAACFAAGFFGVGAQLTMTGLIANFYPARLVSTGVGWSFSVGQLGGVVGPALAGLLLAANLSFGWLMAGAGSLFVLAALAVLLLERVNRAAPILAPAVG
jgi:AAHS family 4-hydroxybenzoate transporter-like MFS transporter